LTRFYFGDAGYMLENPYLRGSTAAFPENLSAYGSQIVHCSSGPGCKGGIGLFSSVLLLAMNANWWLLRWRAGNVHAKVINLSLALLFCSLALRLSHP
jgi:hypothetical protein